MNKFYKTISGVAGAISLFVKEASAANQYGGTLPNPLSACGDISTCVGKVVSFLLTTVAPPILTIMVIYGGFQIITAGGNPEKFKSGRQTLLYAAIGFAVVLLASGVKGLIEKILQ